MLAPYVPHDERIYVCDRFQPVISVWQSTDESLMWAQMEINEPRPVACHGSKRFRCDWFKSFLPVHSQVVRFFPWWHFYWMIHGSRNSDEPFFRGSCVFMRMVSTITEFMSSLEQQHRLQHCSICSLHMCHMMKEYVCDRFQPVISVWQSTDESLMWAQMEINEPRPVACHGSKRFRCDWFKSFLPVHSQVVRFFPWWHFYWMIHGSRNSDEPFFRGSCVFMRMVSTITEFMSSLEQQQSGCTLPYARSMCHMIKKMFAIVFNQWFPFDSQLMNLKTNWPLNNVSTCIEIQEPGPADDWFLLASAFSSCQIFPLMTFF